MADFFAIKQKVRDILTDTLTDEWKVTFGFATKTPPRTWAYFGAMTWPEGEWETTRSRQYQMSMPIVLNAIKPGQMGVEPAEKWLADQVTALFAAFNSQSDLRSVGVISWLLIPRMFNSQPHTEGIEVQTALELRIDYRP